MSLYRKHIFVCENQRDNGDACCAAGAADICGGSVKFMRNALKAKGQHGKGRVRVNRAGCLDCCAQGPVLVVYPQGNWYYYQTEEDLSEIIEKDILADEVVTRLMR
ncbi:MAG: (2Fe-2S) ferredoxin domain-containing protein [Proteobacteria bacterium]|nr:(2Fe-2S) ferredoxin domain-containing protein [Pseudomonadota bacterium]